MQTQELIDDLHARRQAWYTRDWRDPDPDWPPSVADPFPGETKVPEVGVDDLDAEVIHGAIQHHGALIVRELIPRETCERLRDDIDAFWRDWPGYQHDSTPTENVSLLGLDLLPLDARLWPLANGTGYVGDSPVMFAHLLEAFDAAGIGEVVTEYFGERPVFSHPKLAHRRLPETAGGGWHQDGAVYGATARTLNLWFPISRCGDVGPGLDIVPTRLDRLVMTLGDELVEEFAAVEAAVEQVTQEHPPVHPVFEPGDAALFDQWLLHQTGTGHEAVEPRYGFECWFFAPSTMPDPDRWIPIVY